jgi:hypothetical protein
MEKRSKQLIFTRLRTSDSRISQVLDSDNQNH